MKLTNSNMPSVSIIVPVYKAENFIRKCIESIQGQDYPDWELILIDDGSPDNSGLICDEYATLDKRISVFHKKNAGVSAARNTGISLAKGKYLTFVDSDDYVLPTYLSDMLANEADIVVTGYLNSYDPPIKPDFARPIDGDRFYSTENKTILNGLAEVEMNYAWMGPAAKLYLRQIVEEHNIRFDESLDYGEDHLFNMEFGLHIHCLAFLNRHNYVYMHRNVASLTNRRVPEQTMFLYLETLYRYRKLYLTKFIEKEDAYFHFVSSQLNSYFWETMYYLSGNSIISRKEKIGLVDSLFKKFPKDVLYNGSFRLPKTYATIRMLYKVLPISFVLLIVKYIKRT